MDVQHLKTFQRRSVSVLIINVRQTHRPLILLRKSWSMKLITESVMSAPFPFIVLLNCHSLFLTSLSSFQKFTPLFFSYLLPFHSKHDECYVPSLAKMGPQESWDSHTDCGEVVGATGHTGNVLLDSQCLPFLICRSGWLTYKFYWNLVILIILALAVQNVFGLG